MKIEANSESLLAYCHKNQKIKITFPEDHALTTIIRKKSLLQETTSQEVIVEEQHKFKIVNPF